MKNHILLQPIKKDIPMADQKKTFHWRGWTTFLLTISFIVDTVSGIILYIAPPGRIAHWTLWTVWGLDKEQWEAIHTIFGYVLLIIAGIHVYYNWKMFMNFLWSKLRKALHLKWELTSAAVLSLVILLGTIWDIPPFSTTMNLGERFKESWEESKAEVPIAHAELLSLQDFAEKIKVPLDQAIDALKSKGYTVKDAQQTLGEIAKEHNTSPDQLYEAMKSEGVKPTVPETIEGSGLGRKTLEAICAEKGLSLDEALARLEGNGIEAKASDTLKDIANKHGKMPMDIFNIIEGGK
jgi:hypothetical protein